MATAQLTERQQQIKDLLEGGNKPDAIAKRLKITTNAVYQQIRRMRKAGASVSTPSGNGSSGGRSSARRAAPQPRPAAQPTEQRPMTPLQAIRARKSEVEGAIKAADSTVTDAERALDKAREQAKRTHETHSVELKNLEKAEAAIKGEKPPAAPRKRPSRAKGAAGSKADSNGGKADSGSQDGAGAQQAPAPATA